MKHFRRAALAGVGLAVLAPLLTVAPASAATSAPSCVTWKNNQWKMRIEVTNRCKTTRKVKIVVAFGPDSACWTYKPGQRHDLYGPSGRVDRLELC
ncbi:hypothetical protein [Allokutzneria sp. NRRL B-24872]|uniref:hypothetical protein n=1 Tax=Allokutzneria sp. NRRL B-24872 TaxID=1137961 RepID=UPI00117850F4|nr:hypothetical protein [Allokutzneria sp. NRRL B-24872]